MDERQIERELRARREELSEELARLTKPPESGTNLSFGKRVGEGTAEAVERFSSTATAKSLDATLKEIDRALEKLEDGSYGVCDRCGRPIADERLEAIPSTARCVSCSGRT